MRTSFAARIRKQTYTDSDVVDFYMKYRERLGTPFIKEIGDFIAHPSRDRGATLQGVLGVYSQFAFWQRHQSDEPRTLVSRGTCEWWFKSYLLTKLQRVKPSEFRQVIGLPVSKARQIIISWFPSSSYPDSIDCGNPYLLHTICTYFSRRIKVSPAFERGKVDLELQEAFRREGIDRREIDPFLVATTVVTNGASVEIVPGLTAKVSLAVDEGQNKKLPGSLGDYLTPPEESRLRFHWSPHGSLVMIVKTEGSRDAGLLDIATDLLNTQIDSSLYLSPMLIDLNERAFPFLQLDRPLSFERAGCPMVYPVES